MADRKSDEAVSLYLRGLRFHRFGELFAAEEALNDAIEIDPSLGKAWDLLGHIYWEWGRYDDARKSYKKAVKLCPDWIEPVKHLGLLEFTLERYKEAVRVLNKYMKLGGDDISVLVTLARGALNIDRCRVVLTVTSRVIELDEDTYEAWELRGICQAKLSKYNAACISLNMAIDLNPFSVESPNIVGNLCYDQKNYVRAIDFYEISLEVYEDQTEILFRYGTALWLLDRWAEAIEVLERYTKLVPDDPKGWNNLGVALREKGEVKRAIECYRKALALDPNLEIVQKNLETASNMQVIL